MGEGVSGGARVGEFTFLTIYALDSPRSNSPLFALFCTFLHSLHFFCTAPKNSDILMTGSGSKGTFVSCTHLVSRTDVENTQMLKNAT